MALPGLALMLAFHYLPLLGNLIAFQEYLPFGPLGRSAWVGLDNFAVIFNGDQEFLNALKNTLLITLVQVIFVFPAPIALCRGGADLLSVAAPGGPEPVGSPAVVCRLGIRSV